MRVLFVCLRYPVSFWNFEYALRFINKKVAHTPLGLLTVAAMLPEHWEKKLIDLNIHQISVKDLKWADFVFVNGLSIQKKLAREFIDLCKSTGVKIVVGGPLFTSEREQFKDVDHMVLDEAEVTLPEFLQDLEKGVARHIYTSDIKPELDNTPLPAWELIDFNDYVHMSVQLSRGCPNNCDFCDVTNLYGHKPRLKHVDQFINELSSLYLRGWRGRVFIVDDNFIGNKVKIKEEVLPALISWMKKHSYPFVFSTEASINLADDEQMLEMMREACFDYVFVGIETPSVESLKECSKHQNVNRDLVASVKKIHSYGMQVGGGFIVGFDSDNATIFDKQIEFIQQSGIVIAMVGLLNAPIGTKLFKRLEQENRLLQDASGDNTDYSMNFIPKMNRELLMEGYQRLVSTIYEPYHYYQRLMNYFSDYKPAEKHNKMIPLSYFIAMFKAMYYLGVLEKGRAHYWRFLATTLFRHPRFLPDAIENAIYGYHFRKIYGTCSKK